MTLFSFLHLGRPDSLKKRLLLYYFRNPAAEHYLRELALKIDADPANLSRELVRLVRDGLFQCRKQGKLKFFSLNSEYPLYHELKAIMQKTTPVEPLPPHARPHQVYVIAGPNGAGKTTFAKRFLSKHLRCKVFINADLIAGGISPLDVEGAAIKAGKLLLREIEEAGDKGLDFAFETTLSGKSYVRLFQKMIHRGYNIHILFLWIPTVALSIRRVADRVSRGGHAIPAPVIRRRFRRGIQNLFHLYAPLLSSYAIYDNSGAEPVLIAYQDGETKTVVKGQEYEKIKKEARVR